MPTTFTNQATLSYNNQSIPSNVVTGVLTEVLSVSKTAIPAASPGRARLPCTWPRN